MFPSLQSGHLRLLMPRTCTTARYTALRYSDDQVNPPTKLVTLATLCLVLPLLPWAGCATTTRASTVESDGYRYKQPVGTTRTPARLVLEVDPRRKPVGPATLHTFTLQLEETVTAQDTHSVSVAARLVDVVGASGEPALSDQLALALDDLRVTFRRTDRGAIEELRVESIHAPLEAYTARTILFTLLGGARGPVLPQKSIGVQDDWTGQTDAELVGLTAHLRWFYTMLEKRGDVLRFRQKGRIEAIGSISDTRRQLTGDTFSDETVDLAKGAIVSGEYEWSYTVEDDPAGDIAGTGKTRVRAERGAAVKKR